MSVLAWHFLAEDRRLRYGNRQQIKLGVPIEVEGPPIPCKRGLHASLRPLDALCYAPGPIACRVEMSGEILQDSDKLVATRRTVLAWCDATKLLHRFACDVASAALDLAEEKGTTIDERLRYAIAVKRAWLEKQATDDDLIAARSAARVAVRSAARSTARAVAWDTTRDTAWDAARDTAWDVARDAAWVAAEDVAWDAARDATWAATWAVSRHAQNQLLEQALIEELGIHKDKEVCP